MLEHIENKATTLDSMNAFLRWVQQSKIKEDIEKLSREMDDAIAIFNVRLPFLHSEHRCSTSSG